MKKIVTSLAIAAGLLLPCIGAADAAVPEPPYTLTIEFGVDADDGSRIGIAGGTFTIYKAADLAEDGGGGAYYTVVEPYTALAVYDGGRDVTFTDEMTVTESQETAAAFAEIAETAAGEAVTDSSGQCTFTVTEPGMYLVVETDRAEEAAGYETVAPFFVSVPMAQQDEQGNYGWLTDVTALPKTEVTAVPDQPEPSESETPVSSAASDAPKTGDESRVSLYAGLCGASLAMGGLILARRIRSREPGQD